MFSFLSPYATYIKIAKYLAIALFVAWAFRVNHLRGVHEQQLVKVASAVKAAGYPKNGFDELPGDVDQLSATSNTFKQNWQNADAAVTQQNDTIQHLGQQALLNKQTGDAAQKKADALAADRDQWITKAQAASARTELLPDNQELQQCTAALDSLYSENF